MIQLPMMISLSSGLLYLGQKAYGESGNWEVCLSESDLSCAIDIRKKRRIAIPKATEELESLSKSDLELLSKYHCLNAALMDVPFTVVASHALSVPV